MRREDIEVGFSAGVRRRPANEAALPERPNPALPEFRSLPIASLGQDCARAILD